MSLLSRIKDAKRIAPSVSVLSHYRQVGTKVALPKVFHVPGHRDSTGRAKSYTVIARYGVERDNGESIFVTSFEVNEGDSQVACAGNGKGYTTYHCLAAAIVTAELAGRKLSLCQDQASAYRLANIGGRIVKLVSHRAGYDGRREVVWGVVR